jgi:hypothetical protein
MLVDGVVALDPGMIMAMDPHKVERIDVVNSNYYVGALQFPGILSLYTGERNCPLDFPQHSFRQAYEFLSPLRKGHYPEYPDSSAINNPRPDYRNTLYWNPSVRTGEDGRAMAEFYTSDESAAYVIMIEGITAEGLAGSWNGSISVVEQ